MKPWITTFTGAGDDTDITEMLAISAHYPVEWGILFSTKRQGLDPRYPSDPSRFVRPGLRIAAHLCGDHARAVMERQRTKIPLRLFDRVQVNHGDPNLAAVAELQRTIGRPCIVQVRGAFRPEDTMAPFQVFDASGGRGIAPAEWPRHPGFLVGYAGGLGPDTVSAALEAIATDWPYWIDMESGVRSDDRFDLTKCRRVCELVYGY